MGIESAWALSLLCFCRMVSLKVRILAVLTKR